MSVIECSDVDRTNILCQRPVAACLTAIAEAVDAGIQRLQS